MIYFSDFAEAAAPTVTAASAVLGTNSGTSTTAHSFTATTNMTAGDKVILVFIAARTGGSTGQISSVTADSGAISGTAISRNTSNSGNLIGAYLITGVTGTSSVIQVNFSQNYRCTVYYVVLTNTAQTTYHSRSGATPNSASGFGITTGSITIPSGGVGFGMALGIVGGAQTWSQNGGGSPTEDFEVTIAGTSGKFSACRSTSTSATQFTDSSADSGSFQSIAFSWAP